MTIRNAMRVPVIAVLFAFSLGCLSRVAMAQSTDISSPSAVRTNEILGTIAARDIGDARLTDHYYIFTGRPGDLLITVDSKNLNGDIDVFTTAGLRPLLKFTIYAGDSSPITKSVYLRKQESLVLRIEARSPNDDEGTYRLNFGGSFEPITTAPFVAENETSPLDRTTPATTPGKKGRRVSSVGARIEEPPAPVVAAAPTPEPTTVETSKKEEVKPTRPAETTPSGGGATNPKAPARPPRGRRPPGRRTTTPLPPKAEPAPAETDTKAVTAENSETAPKPSPSKKRPAGRTTTSRTAKAAPVEPEPESGPRLIIETSDGTLINRYMSSVRRVVVENGQVVVTAKDGKIERVPLASVVRMSIAP
jgi:hypothetical protein